MSCLVSRWCVSVVIPHKKQGYTALHLAADRGNAATVEFLLKQGADKTLKVSARAAFSRYERVDIR